MRRLNLRIDSSAMQTIWCVLLLAVSANAANLTVKAGGGGNYTTIQACATAMAAGDTCTVYAGTYNENVTVPAGAAGNYKTITVNGSDVVTVQSFVLNSHTKLIGNCPTPTVGNAPAANTCGFNIQNPSSPNSATCVSANGVTDVYIRNNRMYECGSGSQIKATSGSTFIYIQGNTMSYACTTPATATSSKNCNSMLLVGDHFLVENNDISHYTLGIDINASYSVYRNNIAHDQFETEAGGNSHSDWWFAEPGVPQPTEYNVIEGNVQYNAVGPNAKGVLAQGDTACGGVCFNLIERFNSASRTGSGYNSNNGNADWPRIKIYNNTIVDAGYDLNLQYGDADNSEKSTNGAFLNQIYYFTQPSITSFNAYSCGPTGCTAGSSLYWCTGICTTVFGHTYGIGTWLGDLGNKNADPKFVNYVSVGSPSNDYHLQAGSPAIAAGTYLATVASGDSGSGTSLVVNDAAYFQDGYGLSNAYSTVSPDCIAVGTASNQVCITAVNYSTNTLTLASSITRSAGQGVYLYSKSDGVQVLTGSAPDMGAHPYTGSITTSTLAPPSSPSAVTH